MEAAEDHVCFRVARTRGSRLVLTADYALLGAISIHQHEGEAVVDFWVAERSEPERWHCVHEPQATV